MNLKEEFKVYLSNKAAFDRAAHGAFMEMAKAALPKDVCIFCGNEDGWENETQATFSVMFWREIGPVCTRRMCEKKARKAQEMFHFERKAPILVKKG